MSEEAINKASPLLSKKLRNHSWNINFIKEILYFSRKIDLLFPKISKNESFPAHSGCFARPEKLVRCDLHGCCSEPFFSVSFLFIA